MILIHLILRLTSRHEETSPVPSKSQRYDPILVNNKNSSSSHEAGQPCNPPRILKDPAQSEASSNAIYDQRFHESGLE